MSKDFHYNKRVCDDVAVIPSKRIRNKVAGYATVLMKRIERGPVRGISLKLQEEERERKMEFIPKESEFTVDQLNVDNDTEDMLRALNLENVLRGQFKQ